MTADELMTARAAMGLTQTKFGSKLGCSLRTIQRMESGERPISVRTAMAVKGLLEDTERTRLMMTGR